MSDGTTATGAERPPGETDLRSTVTTAVEDANLPALPLVLVQLIGDDRWLEDPYRPSRNRSLDDNADRSFDEHTQREIRAAQRWDH